MSSTSHVQIETGKLIKLVRNYPLLYDASHPRYKDNEVKNATWCRITELLGLENSKFITYSATEIVKTKWRNLRDSYVKYLKCITMKGPSLRKYSRWPWANKMEFLKPHLPMFGKSNNNGPQDGQEGQDGSEQSVPVELQYGYTADLTESQQENSNEEQEDDDEDRKVFDILQIKRPRVQSPEDLMARRVSNMEAIDHLFLSYAQTLKTFSHKRQVMIKSQLANMMNQAELEEIAEQDDDSLQPHLEYNDSYNNSR